MFLLEFTGVTLTAHSRCAAIRCSFAFILQFLQDGAQAMIKVKCH